MLAFLNNRRSFLLGAGSVGIDHMLLESEVEAQTEARGYVLGAAEGETSRSLPQSWPYHHQG
jgi:hypothetical protein